MFDSIRQFKKWKEQEKEAQANDVIKKAAAMYFNSLTLDDKRKFIAIMLPGFHLAENGKRKAKEVPLSGEDKQDGGLC